MYFEGPELVDHYHRWLEANQEVIDSKLAACLDTPDPKAAITAVTQVMLQSIIPMALAEMTLFNNTKLEEKIKELLEEGGGCSGCK
jgi:hypothetical protein